MSDTSPSTQACAAKAAPRRTLGAWQPFTGNGLSRFADTGAGRTLGFLGAFALATALVLGWTLQTAWWPVVDLAIREFPEQGPALTGGRFAWPESTPRLLADSPHLGVAVRPENREPVGRTADLQLELLPGTLRLAGIAGFVDIPWPAKAEVPLGRLEARAAWEAWRRPLLGASVIAVAALMTVAWGLLALLLAPLLRIGALPMGRRITLGGCWRLGAAALMGASLVLDLGLGGYAMRWLPWPALAAVAVLHLVVASLQICWGLLSRPRGVGEGRPSNPFGAGGTKPGSRKPKGNPFGG